MSFCYQSWICFNLNFEIDLIREFLLSARKYFVWLISQVRDSITRHSNIKLRACMHFFQLCIDVANMHNVLMLMTDVDD